MLVILGILLPAAGAAAALLPGPRGKWLPVGAAAAGVVALAIGVAAGSTVSVTWLAVPWRVDLQLHLGGFGGALALLAGLATAICAWSGLGRSPAVRALVLALGAAAVGVFAARDLIVLYVFWELMLIPGYFLISGTGARRAALQFLVYNVAGSLFMLLAFLAIGASAGSFDLPATHVVLTGLLVLGLMLGFAAKAPFWPLHGWQADAYAAAPPEAAALLAGVQSKAGIFGFYLIALPALPPGARPWLLGVGLISVLYGVLAAIGQDTLRRMLAYSSLGHLGLILLGLASGNPVAVEGAIILAIAHGLYTVALFMLAGRLEEALRKPVYLADLGGLYAKAPGMGAFFSFAAMAALGLPGLAGFPGELLILIGLAHAYPWVAAGAGLGMVLAAVYMIRAVQAIFHGRAAAAPPLRVDDAAAVVPLLALLLALGLDPQLIWGVAHP